MFSTGSWAIPLSQTRRHECNAKWYFAHTTSCNCLLPISDAVTIPVTAERVRSVRQRCWFKASRFLWGTSSLQVCSLQFGLVSVLFVSMWHYYLSHFSDATNFCLVSLWFLPKFWEAMWILYCLPVIRRITDRFLCDLLQILRCGVNLVFSVSVMPRISLWFLSDFIQILT